MENPRESLGAARIADECTGEVWDAFAEEIDASWRAKNSEELQLWATVISGWIARGYQPNVAAFCLEYVRAAHQMTLWEPSAVYTYDWDDIYGSWSPEERASMRELHDELLASLQRPIRREVVLA